MRDRNPLGFHGAGASPKTQLQVNRLVSRGEAPKLRGSESKPMFPLLQITMRQVESALASVTIDDNTEITTEIKAYIEEA